MVIAFVIVVSAFLFQSWALYRCTKERDRLSGELFIAKQKPSIWLDANDFERHGDCEGMWRYGCESSNNP